ncbi:MAG: hypothetical protein MUC96_22440 [Myxococcaceae bacterium]|jgi:hypothetical protein|nr:hypothetical protein [Myxococcaceae bacterium]
MGSNFCIRLSAPRHGWLGLTLAVDERELDLIVSHTPYDSLAALTSAMVGVLEGNRPGLARFNCEPAEFELHVAPGARPEEARLTVVHFEGRGGNASRHEVVLVHEAHAVTLGRAVWRALRRLEGELEPPHWNHPFPTHTVERLGALTRRLGRTP